MKNMLFSPPQKKKKKKQAALRGFQLDTGRIWDYASDVFVHRRLVQHAAMGLIELALPAPAIPESSGGKVGDGGLRKLLI